MKRMNILNLYIVIIVLSLGCNNVDEEVNITESLENTNVVPVAQSIKKYEPINEFGSGFWTDTIRKFDVTIFSDLLKNDTLEKARSYLEKNKPTELNNANLNVYKSNLSSILIREGKFEEVINVLSEVIDSKDNSNVISARLLRSEAYVQIGLIEKAIDDLTHVAESGGRSRWRAYRQRGIIKYETLRDSIGGCEDLKKGIANSYTKEIYKRYCD